MEELLKKCTTCELYKPFSQFSKKTSNPDGHQGQCKKCNGLRYRYKKSRNKNSVLIIGNKICPKCKINKPYNEFYACAGLPNGHSSHCKWCVLLERKTIKSRYRISKASAKHRNHEWQLTLEEYTNLIQNKCFYCGGILPQSGIGLDRIDNAKGYTTDNVNPCCTICNETRQANFTVEQMLEIKPWLINCRFKREKVVK